MTLIIGLRKQLISSKKRKRYSNDFSGFPFNSLLNQVATELLDKPDRLIGLILLFNNAVNLLASSLVTIIALRHGGDAAIAVGTGLLILVILIFAEVTPKTLAARHPERSWS